MIKITSTIFKRRSKINERIKLSKYQEIYVSNVLILMSIYKNFKQGITNILMLITSWLYLYEITKNCTKNKCHKQKWCILFYTYEDSGECSGACNWNCIHQMEKTVEDEF